MDATIDKKQRMVLALLRFNKSWEELAAASIALPELDVSASYPFFLMDYETLYPAVKQWCLVQASALLSEIPDTVPNPACVTCPHVFDGLTTQGVCKGQDDTQCNLFPTIHFERAAVLPFCLKHNIETEGLSDEMLQLTYTRKVTELHDKQSKSSLHNTRHDGPLCNSCSSDK